MTITISFKTLGIMSGSVPLGISVYPNHFIVTEKMIVKISQMKLDAVSCFIPQKNVIQFNDQSIEFM